MPKPGMARRRRPRLRTLRDLSIKGKLIGIIMLTSTVALALACTILLGYEFVTDRRAAAQQLTTLARIVAENSTAALAFEDHRSAAAMLGALEAEPHLVAACLYTKDGRPFASFVRGASRRDLPRRPAKAGASFAGGHLTLFADVWFEGKPIGTLYLNRDLQDQYDRLARYCGIVMSVLVAASLVALLLSSKLHRVISEPLLHLGELACRVSAERDYSLRAARHGNDEIGLLVDRFNEMMEQTHSRAKALHEADRALKQRVNELDLEIAERRSVQAELLAAKQSAEESNRAKSAFLANMSHELRTPLNAIIGYSEMLREDAEEAGRETCAHDLARITSAGKHLLVLINDVLDLSKVEAGRIDLIWENVPVAEILEDAVGALHPLADKNGNRVAVTCAPGLGDMHVDVVKFRQSLYNLISNACKFTGNGTVSMEVMPGTTDGADWIEWRVSDTGIGIAPDQIQKLFQPFSQVDTSTTRKYGGTGLGLAISQRFCQLMGGGITVASQPGLGSTFTIRLPYSHPARGTPLEVQSSSAMRAGEATAAGQQPEIILVIDDDATVHDLMCRSLAKEGFDVRVAFSGEEGLRMAREIRPDAITLDVFMPGMDGWAVLAALKADPELSDIPVVLLTIADDRGRACLLGAADFLQKPVECERLVSVLQKCQAGALPGPLLVVDDDPASREMAAHVLRKRFGCVMEAADGLTALALMERQKPGLILLDLMMPGMDGFEFIAAVRRVEEWRDVPIIILTAKDIGPPDRERLRGVGRILQKADLAGVGLTGEVADLLKSGRANRAALTVPREKH